MFESIRQDAQRKGLRFGDSFMRRLTVRQDAGQFKDFCEPTAVVLVLTFNCEGH